MGNDAPSNANTSGLEVVVFRVHDWSDGWIYFESEYWAGRECKDDDREPQPLVTAASAQARIDAAEARADRLATALKYARYHVVGSLHSDRQQALDQIDAALQQETQP